MIFFSKIKLIDDHVGRDLPHRHRLAIATAWEKNLKATVSPVNPFSLAVAVSADRLATVLSEVF